MKLKTCLLAAIAALGASVGTASAWDVVAVRDVADRTDHDTVRFEGHRRFNHVKFCVFRHPVHFFDVDVYFENGGHQSVRVAQRLNPGRCTRAIDLEGGQRDIERIDFVYEETSFRRATATVRVLAE
jgi:hypothetical protein